MTHPILLAVLLLSLLAVSRVSAAPPSREEGERRNKFIAELKTIDAAESTAGEKIAAVAGVFKAEPSPDVRRVVFDTLHLPPGPELDSFLTDVLTGDPDAGLRGLAATALGQRGTEQCLPTLAKAAATDPTTEMRMDCILMESSARRSATFAIAEFAARFPAKAEQGATELRRLTPVADPKDNQSLADARAQALYQVTRDEQLLAPFLEQLRSKDAKTRQRGAVAFRFFKLKAAPPELVAALTDVDPDVRSWAGLVLGEIGDPQTVPALMAVAEVRKKDAGLRCNVIDSLGTMKAAVATGLMRKLLTEEDPAVQTVAAIALYRLTGEKVKQFPAGFDAD